MLLCTCPLSAMKPPSLSESQFGVQCPSCAHGPMLSLATQPTKYACSAFRRQGDCEQDRIAAQNSISSTRWPVDRLRSSSPCRRGYCLDCDSLFLVTSKYPDHRLHQCHIGLADELLNMPTYLLRPLEKSESNAQYLYSLDTLNELYSLLHQLNIQFVVCVGCPRLHEFIQLERRIRGQKIDSYLLDIDFRLQYFHKRHFSRYNMVNNYFFSSEHRSQFQQFCQHMDGNGLIFCDPPFAAPLRLLLDQLARLGDMLPTTDTPVNHGGMNSDRHGFFPVMITLPHFFDRKLKKINPLFTLLDYKVGWSPGLHIPSNLSRLPTQITGVSMVAHRRKLPSLVGAGIQSCAYSQICRRLWYAPRRA
ncbi:hypothetical protein CRM22_004258 [Opisthorchis felineus]|uniref:Uncharacterized protein n=1 Tax=Opisthorchis felineus TaxID=147828 RepID=A0A4S2M3I9_OPIFE|nr:hypothetical protein CRM22_004258 [Opisthorchis felineus]TGZ68420.1 hypothetical protein CRM22_004258 [Opisthorchis felineus]